MKTKTERQSYEKAGRRAEFWAAGYLRLKGYRILARRYKTKQGEIDIIARKGKIIVIAEVKYRKDVKNIHDSVSFKNSQRIMNAAEIYLTRNPVFIEKGFELRFDIIHVIGRRKINHIADAFRGY